MRICSSPTSRFGLAIAYLPWLILLGCLTYVAWFLTDDAFISFRYARNLLEGHGLVFNPGERVEGYSNFLWVLELAAIWGLFGLRPEQVAPWLSVACTVGTLAAMLWWVSRLPELRHRGLVAWMALGLVCSSVTFAAWTSGGGLETRQFTLFVVLSIVCLSLYGDSLRGLLGTSLFLSVAALTRPEGPLIAACCVGWFIVVRMVKNKRLRVDWRELAYLVVPFVAIVGAHFLFRYAYYGEWLPNTYYAKHVRPWYDMGLRYLYMAALETGLYLLLPLVVLSLSRGWRARHTLTYILPLLCIISHMAYIARIGGDHFEYRPLDFYWPLLAVPAAEGLVHLGLWLSAIVRRYVGSRHYNHVPPPRLYIIFTILVFLPMLFYASAMQLALLIEDIREPNRVVTLNEENSTWLLAAPGMAMLSTISNDLRTKLFGQYVGRRFAKHREIANSRLRQWQPYRNMKRGIIPDDAVMVTRGAGILPYYLLNVKFIDWYGLNDKTIARNPVTLPNSERRLAHDREPPLGYLEQRGVNFEIFPAANSAAGALYYAPHAVPVGPNLWMPFKADPQWAQARFADLGLRSRTDFDDLMPLIEALVRGRAPVIRSVYDVYLVNNELVYVQSPCKKMIDGLFFLHVFPVALSDLPDGRQLYGYDNLDFQLDTDLIDGEACLAIRRLPDYDIATIRTGQYHYRPGEHPHLWSGSFEVKTSNHR